MPRVGKQLTDTEVRAAKSGDKVYNLYDTGGLYLEVVPSGGKRWRVKFYYQGKESRLSLGIYPAVGLKLARQKRDEIKELLELGVNPSELRKKQKQELEQKGKTFAVVAEEWLKQNENVWSESHLTTTRNRLEHDLIPELGNTPIIEITSNQLLATLQVVVTRGAIDTAHRELAICSQIWRYAMSCGYCQQDITYSLKSALPPVVRGHFGAIIDPEQLGRLLNLIESYPGGVTVRNALWLQPRLFVRPGELRLMRWQDIDFANREWRYLVTKTKQPHIVPLAAQVIEKIESLRPLSGRNEWVLPSLRNQNKPLSNMALSAALKTIGIPGDMQTAHGFRATARTLLDEALGFRLDIVEHQLAHTVKDPLRRAYNRTSFLPERHKLMQIWSDYLDDLKVKYGT